MYSRFYRWASDRIVKDGMIAFVTNSSFIDSKTFDGFRKTVFEEFNEIYVIDLGGNVRKNPKLSGTKNNVFGIQTGVAIMFLIKKADLGKCKLFYLNPFADLDIKEHKLSFLKYNKFNQLKSKFELIIPDKKHNWLNQTDNDWDDLIPMGTKECKLNKTENAIFKLFSNGIMTDRDEWVYDFCKNNLINKVKHFIEKYNKQVNCGQTNNNELDYTIKWSRDLKNKLKRKILIKYSPKLVTKAYYRPFRKVSFYSEIIMNDVLSQNHFDAFGNKFEYKNCVLTFTGLSSISQFTVFSTNLVFDRNFYHHIPQFIPIYRYDSDGNRIDNITNWGLNQFKKYYQYTTITKKDVFNYCYAVLHSPKYREKYAVNLKQDLPRIPFYKNFTDLVKIGAELINLHVNFEQVEPYNLTELSHETNKPNTPKLKLSTDKSNILIDEITTLTNFPIQALDYKLGNRSAIEWILDGYKEKKIKDPTINKMFNNYKFSDYKLEVIDLLKRVTTVSLKSMELIGRIDK